MNYLIMGFIVIPKVFICKVIKKSIYMKLSSIKNLNICFLVLLLTGCAGDAVKQMGNNDFFLEKRVWSTPAAARSSLLEQARSKCATNPGQGIDINGEGTAYDSVGMVYRIRFGCYDIAQRQREEAARAEAAALERRRQAEKRAEEERQAEIQRKQREAEWERTRPQREAQERKERAAREAEAKRQQEAERQRLAVLCPIYWVARQTCGSASNYQSCMNIRMSNKYSSWDDSTCINR